MASRAVSSTCSSSGKDTKQSSAPCPWLRDRHTLTPFSLDGPSWQNKGHHAVLCLLPMTEVQPQLSHIPCSQAPGKARESPETFCKARGTNTGEYLPLEKGETPAAPTLWCKHHQPSAKEQGISSKCFQGKGIKMTDCHTLIPFFLSLRSTVENA